MISIGVVAVCPTDSYGMLFFHWRGSHTDTMVLEVVLSNISLSANKRVMLKGHFFPLTNFVGRG